MFWICSRTFSSSVLAVTTRADTTGGNRNVVLSWIGEPTGLLRIMRGTDPSNLSMIATTTGASWTDVGGLDSPDPLVCYRVDGPCP